MEDLNHPVATGRGRIIVSTLLLPCFECRWQTNWKDDSLNKYQAHNVDIDQVGRSDRYREISCLRNVR